MPKPHAADVKCEARHLPPLTSHNRWEQCRYNANDQRCHQASNLGEQVRVEHAITRAACRSRREHDRPNAVTRQFLQPSPAVAPGNVGLRHVCTIRCSACGSVGWVHTRHERETGMRRCAVHTRPGPVRVRQGDFPGLA